MEQKQQISIDHFHTVDIRIGEILSAEKIEGADKLLKLSVSLGEELPRQIVSGIAPYYSDPQILVGKKCAFVANLEPLMIRGYESNGMILAVSGDTFFSLLETGIDVTAGVSVK